MLKITALTLIWGFYFRLVGADAPVIGPIVRHDEFHGDTLAITASGPGGLPLDSNSTEKHGTFAEYLDKRLEDEFRNEELASQTKQDLNETLSKEKNSHLEQVVHVSGSKRYNSTDEQSTGATAAGTGTAADGAAATNSWEADPTGTAVSEQRGERESDLEQDVDRLIDSDRNEYILSRPHGGFVLTLDPQLVQDLTVVLTGSSLFGWLFEVLRQPVINGFILAGSVAGPDGFALVREVVQVESLAQVGVQLLLFGLGMEFSADKLREVGSVAILGGAAQIGLFVAACAIGALAIGGELSEGIFVGCLLSMSSTSVVIKSLGDTSRSSVSQIVIGTLILQDCSVGLMFALMPVLSSLKDPASGLDPETTGEIVLLILKVLFKLAMMLAATGVLAQGAVPAGVMYIKRHFSGELFQTSIVAYCLSCAWLSGRLGLSHELGAFLAGIMLGSFEGTEAVLCSTEQVRNVFTGLFLASIGLVISPVFILEHFRILAAGALMVLFFKAALIATVVWYFKRNWTISWSVGLSLAQVGEFAFVLLSLASQLGLINSRLSLLLLGITAISLMTTPLVLALTRRVLVMPTTPRRGLPLVSPFLPKPPLAQRHALEFDSGSGVGRSEHRGESSNGRRAKRAARQASPTGESVEAHPCTACAPNGASWPAGEAALWPRGQSGSTGWAGEKNAEVEEQHFGARSRGQSQPGGGDVQADEGLTSR